MRIITLSILLALAAAMPSAQRARIPALPESEWTPAHRELVATYSRDARPGNDLRTFLNHPELVKGVLPFLAYITSDSTLPARDRTLLILRTAILFGSEYVWNKHVNAASKAGFNDQELIRIASPQSPIWTPFEASLFRAVEELHRDSFVSDATWRALSARYDRQQLMDAVFTVAEIAMISMTTNSLRLPKDTTSPLRFIVDPVASDKPFEGTSPRDHDVLAQPRIPPLAPSEWTPEVRAMLDPTSSGREIAAVYRTFAQHPKLYPPRQVLSEYIRLKSTLSPRIRELLILRIGYLCGSDYEWAAHARAGRQAGLTDEEIRRLAQPSTTGWSTSDAALVTAVDELYANDTISDHTWSALAAQFDNKQLLDLLITTGGYRMVSMALNTFGVPLERDGERIPR